MQELCSNPHITGSQGVDPRARLGVQERGARVQLGEVAEQLQVARLQHKVHAQLVAQRQRAHRRQRLALLGRQARHLRMALRQLVVRAVQVDGQEALRPALPELT